MKMTTMKSLLFISSIVSLIVLTALIDNVTTQKYKTLKQESGPFLLNPDNINISDFGNDASAADIHLTIDFPLDNLYSLTEIRLILAKAASKMNTDLAISLNSSCYTFLNISPHIDTWLSGEMRDSDGDLITNEVTYRAYLLLLSSDPRVKPALSKASNKLTLKDELLVTTVDFPYLADEDLEMDRAGNIYINGGSLNKSKIFKIAPDGSSSIFSDKHNHPVGITSDNEGNIYVTNYESTNIDKILTDGLSNVFVSDAKLVGGGGIIIDDKGRLFNTFYASSTIYEISEGKVKDFVTSDKFNGPVGLAYDHERDKIYVASFNTGKIFLVEREGSVVEIADIPATIGHLAYSNNFIYATGWKEHKVFQVSLSGKIIWVIGTGNQGDQDGNISIAEFSQPNGICVSNDGKCVYVSQGNGKIRKIIL